MKITANTIVIDWDGSLILSNITEVIVGETYNIIDFKQDYQGEGKITEHEDEYVEYEEVK